MIRAFSYFASGDFVTGMMMILSSLFVVLCCTPIHEFAHGYVAYKLGDDTAKAQGRLTINPLAHLDLIGSIMILLFGIGYAKPVPVSARRLKNPKRDMAIIAIAGPLSNLIMGFIYNFIAMAISHIANYSSMTSAFYVFFTLAAEINVMLAVFNLIPIPPLDGSKVLASALPTKTYFKYMQYERYIMIGLMILLFTGALNGVIRFLTGIMMSFISIIPNLIFK